ncbi:MAG: ParB/RepB/Spo0J family partition protein [Lachnospiraceae bacterium]|nr:ParB/RepB/Spo0J family partition protein [Lachnospiraceae bacterium]
MAIKREKVHFESVEELLGAPVAKDVTEEIQIEKIHAFKSHPFKVLDDDKMTELVKSISVNGILTPVLLRPDGNGTYEMISGHRRMHAAKLAGLKTIPAVIKEMNDDDAVIAMVNANVQREEILPSERAFSLKMKMDAMRRQGSRTDKEEMNGTCRLQVDKFGDKKTCDIVGKDFGLGGRQVQRYVRLTELIDKLLELVDAKKIGVNMAVDIAAFDKELQGWIYEYYKDNGFLKPTQIEALKNTGNTENITQSVMIQILNNALPEKKISGKVSLSEKKLDKFFPPHFSAKQREMVIIGLLEKWHGEQK